MPLWRPIIATGTQRFYYPFARFIAENFQWAFGRTLTRPLMRALIRAFTTFLILVLLMTSQAAVAASIKDKWQALSREDKLHYTNIAGMVAIGAWGVTHWDYGQRSPHLKSEGWFGEGTTSGGVDKLGHLYTGYVSTRALTPLLQSWGFPQPQALRYAALSSFTLFSFMELGDAFSATYGFSYEDFLMNGLGSYVGYLFESRPNLAKKFDLRIEYQPGSGSDVDIFTDYEHTKYLVAMKLDGFDTLIDYPYLRYLEFHVGYYSRGFGDGFGNGFGNGFTDDFDRGFDAAIGRKKRKVYLGIGINFSAILRRQKFNKTATFLQYVQLPHTDVQFVL